MGFALPGHGRSGRLKYDHIIALTAQEGPRHGRKLHGGIDENIFSHCHTVFLQNILQDDRGHPAFTPSDNGLAFQVAPLEVGVRFPAH